MKMKLRYTRHRRRGASLILIVLLIVPLVAMVAFAVDYGYLLKVRGDLQRAADMTALAAVRDLTPSANGYQDKATVIATAKAYAAEHFGGTFTVLDSDVEIGRYDPSTIYSQVDLLNSGVWDTVRVTLRRDSKANSPVSLFFAPVIGKSESDVVATATAVLQKGRDMPPGVGVLPFAVPKDEWDALAYGNEWRIYGDGKVKDQYGNDIPGNWGAVDIGAESNSTSDQNEQIENGLHQSHLDSLYQDGRIAQDTHIDAAEPAWMEADPGLSSGLKNAVQAVHGETRLIPIYSGEQVGGGNNLEYHVTEWGVVDIVDSSWNGAMNTYVRIRKAYTYEGLLRPISDLSATDGYIPAAFTSPALVE